MVILLVDLAAISRGRTYAFLWNRVESVLIRVLYEVAA